MAGNNNGRLTNAIGESLSPAAIKLTVPAGWLLPPVFGDLRRLLEARMGKAGKREYVQVLRLIESFSLDDVRAAISEALERGVIGFDAVKHLVLCAGSRSGRHA